MAGEVVVVVSMLDNREEGTAESVLEGILESMAGLRLAIVDGGDPLRTLRPLAPVAFGAAGETNSLAPVVRTGLHDRLATWMMGLHVQLEIDDCAPERYRCAVIWGMAGALQSSNTGGIGGIEALGVPVFIEHYYLRRPTDHTDGSASSSKPTISLRSWHAPQARYIGRHLRRIVEGTLQSGGGEIPGEDPVPLDVAVGKQSPKHARQTGSRIGRTWSAGIVVVDKAGNGDFESLTMAVEKSPPETIIHVLPGVYRGGLVLDKPLHIVGIGDRTSTVVAASGSDGILSRANAGTVSNLTVRQLGGGNWFGVNIVTGSLDVVDCDLASESAASLVIVGGASPTVRGNRIHDGKLGGVQVRDGGRGLLEDNDIYANSRPGVIVSTGGNPMVRGNRIHDGKASGVYVYDDGTGVFESNEIYANTRAGISVAAGGNPTVRGNRIHDGKASGVYVYDHGLGAIEDNDIFANALCGISVARGGNPTVRRNRIHHCGRSGIYVYEQGLGVLEDNDIYANGIASIRVASGGNPAVQDNRMRGRT